MFEGGNVYPMFSSSIGGNKLQYDTGGIPLQLFGDPRVGYNIDSLNCGGVEHNHLIETVKGGAEVGSLSRELKHPISLNNNSFQDNAGHSGYAPNVVSTGLRLSYEGNEHNSSLTFAGKGVKAKLLSLYGNLKVEIDQQKKELDCYIKFQEENTIKGLRELRLRHMVSFLSAIERGVSRKLYEKELEIENMNNKNRELLEKIKQVSVELQSWQYRAKYNESVVNVLKNNLQQVMAQSVMCGNGDREIEEVASCTNSGYQGVTENAGDLNSLKRQMNCRACKVKDVRVLMLPCRHLCVCRDCEVLIDVCLVCGITKTASVEVLKVYQFPVTVTAIQFAVGALLVLFLWTFNLYKRPKISGSLLAAILPLAVVHTLGNLFTNMSLGKVAVSFTHTIKAMEPFFSVVLSAIFLGEMPTALVVASLVPIVGGVALASITEASFNWAGFGSAMASNLTFQSRNVLSKKVMVNKQESMDNINLFSTITVMSFFLLSPVAIFMEGIKFTPAYLQSAGLNVRQLYTRSLISALCFHAYQQVSYMILQRVSPVTHSVGNCVKRVVVIVSSVLFFKTPVSPVNALGTGIALAGVFLYSRAKRVKPKPKTA